MCLHKIKNQTSKDTIFVAEYIEILFSRGCIDLNLRKPLAFPYIDASVLRPLISMLFTHCTLDNFCV